MFKTKTRRIKLTRSVFGPWLHLSASILLNCRFYRPATTVGFHNAQSSKALYITFCVGPAHSFQPAAMMHSHAFTLHTTNRSRPTCLPQAEDHQKWRRSLARLVEGSWSWFVQVIQSVVQLGPCLVGLLMDFLGVNICWFP